MHYYKFHIADYRKDTAHLTPIEHYIYRALIDWYYLDETPIAKETNSVLRRLSLGCEFEPNLMNVLTDFFTNTDEGWFHNRIDTEIVDYHAKSEKNKANGKAGGRPKKTQTKAKETQSVLVGNPVVTLTNNHKPLTNNQDIELPIGSSSAEARQKYPPDFEEFWSLYPQHRKPSKASAYKAWKSQKVNGHAGDVIGRLKLWIASDDWKKEGGKYVVNAHKWLSERRWEGEIPDQKQSTKPLFTGNVL